MEEVLPAVDGWRFAGGEGGAAECGDGVGGDGGESECLDGDMAAPRSGQCRLLLLLLLIREQ